MGAVMGRPKKLKETRSKYTIYLDDETRKAIDEFEFREKQKNPDYSRSDFLSEAAAFYLEAQKGDQ